MSKFKKWLTMGMCALLACFVAVGLVACGGSGDSGSGDSGDAGGSDGTGKKVAMILDGPVNDGGWGASCYDAMCAAAKDHGWTTAYSESVDQADWVTVMQDYVDQGYDLVIAPGNQYTSAVEDCAKANPDAKFCIFNDDVTDYDNIECTMPDTVQIGEVAGVMAGLLSTTNNIGFIGAMELDTTLNKIQGYTEAAQKVNPDAKVTVAYANSFSDAAKGKELATNMINSNNVDVMFGDASIVDTGAREALEAAGAGHYDIGQPGNIGSEDNAIIAVSVVTDNAKMTNQVLDDVENDTFGKKTIKGDLANGCVYAGTISTKICDQETIDKFNEYVEQIKNGTF
ncbi:BMP family protein [Olsenella sp. YH-ols2217]|uniref:BMP family protein n=1 Tax=Kribbibacterium absianum TaxID=3044210 RepID=A0ABT6ZHS4_9ACTN|nr:MULTISPECIES: BMP family protein [unclassified Olsenella]MDJ1121112.1 BMP family protein [Olsenella sp. YH-ols2216]MDJ1128603.1 BMP family protein [Olsenella sp. YH-ols2217]